MSHTERPTGQWVPVTIRYADGESTVKVNEGELALSESLQLGRIPFREGSGGLVTIGPGTDGTRNR